MSASSDRNSLAAQAMTLDTLRKGQGLYVAGALVIGLFTVLYWRVFQGLYLNWTAVDSYYSHGFLIPPISLYFVWKQRDALLKAPIVPNAWGYVLLVATCLWLLASDFLGLRVFAQVSILPMLAGLILAFFGTRHLQLMWFPLAFLVFMIPIPPSLTQSISLRIKLLATELAVRLAQLVTLPVIRDGSYIRFNHDQLLVGEVCGGLRSLIALLAFGALMSYLSKTRTWARLVILAVSGPIAVVSNITRIFGLCVVGYFWGSGVAAGKFHDISGVLIFVVAFVLLFALESLLRWLAPMKKEASS